jgi:hypothetical protein
MNIKISYSMMIATIFVFVSTGVAQEAKSFFSVQDILSGWQSNYGALKSMKVSYSEEVISAEPPMNDPNMVNRMVKWVYVEKTEEGRKFRAKSAVARVKPLTAEKSFDDINSVEEMTFDGMHQGRYSPAGKKGQIFAGSLLRNASTINRFKVYLLSNPYLENSGVESEESVFSHTIKEGLYDPNYTISVRPYLEEVAGQMCHVLVLEHIKKDKTKAKVAIIWVAHEKGMLPVKYQEFGTETRIAYEIAVEEVGFAETENGGLWYPKRAFNFWNIPETLGIIKQELNVLEFVPNIKTDANTFQITFPNGTQVTDTEVGINYTVGVK